MRKEIDVFPAIIKLAPPNSLEDFTDLKPVGDSPKGTRKLDRCRAVVIGGVLIIAEDSPEGPKVVFREQTQAMAQDGRVTHILTTSGKIIVVSKDDNCGCGSRLRGWNPYGSYVVSNGDPNDAA